MYKTQEELMLEELKLEEEVKNAGRDALKLALQQAEAQGMVATNTTLGRSFFYHKVRELHTLVVDWLAKNLKPKPGVKASFVFALEDLAKVYEDNNELADMLASITLTHVINAIGSSTAKSTILNNTASVLGTKIETEYLTKSFEIWLAQPEQKDKKNALNGIDKRVKELYRKTYLVQAMKKNGFVYHKWAVEDKTGLGMHLIMLASAATGYFDVVPDYSNNKLYSIALTPQFAEAWRRNEANILDHAYKLTPMVVEPKPWASYTEGGYYGMLACFNSLLRLKGSETSYGREYLSKLEELDLSDVLKAVNAIQSTPWCINKEVLSVMQYFRDLGYVPCGGEVSVDGEPINVVYTKEAPKPYVLPEQPTEEQIAAYKKVMPTWYKYEGRRASLANRADSAINIANKFKDYDEIYFPYNMDFRGRIYPIPVFSPQGDDLAKSLILFAHAPACTSEDCFNFMAITGANLAGVDKVSYDDRVAWVLENEQSILASAEDPTGYRWWMSQDEPCQMLAWCFEWKKMRDYQATHNGSIIGWSTGFPYAQDGTCSGLQHFSAILRDPVGAEAVNLLPQDKPNDVYAQVAVKVNESLKVLAMSGSADSYDEEKMRIIYGDKTLAQLWLSYGVTRKVTKRPTMTLAYGATKAGYKDQILEDTIKKAMRVQGESCVFNKNNMVQAAKFMADQIWEAVGKTVVKAVEGMDWLHKCAREVSKASNVVSWVTPMGLLVQQNYLKYEVKVVKLRCMGKRFRIYAPHQTGQIDRIHQAQAVAPNFIHSMDAAHLQLTLNRSYDAGIRHFAMIHDSYGCPMAQAQQMYDIVRQAFVDMYTDNDVLEQFKECVDDLTDKQLPDPPAKGDFDLSVVKDSKYIFC